jgi:hypothetical protein
MDKGTRVIEPSVREVEPWEASTMLGAIRKTDRARCLHTQTVTVSSAGMDRVVCEACGYVSFSYGTELTSDIDRGMFARDIERTEDTESVGALG